MAQHQTKMSGKTLTRNNLFDGDSAGTMRITQSKNKLLVRRTKICRPQLRLKLKQTSLSLLAAYRSRALPQSRNATASSRSGSSLIHSFLPDKPLTVKRSFHAAKTYIESPCCHGEKTVEHLLRSVGDLGASPPVDRMGRDLLKVRSVIVALLPL